MNNHLSRSATVRSRLTQMARRNPKDGGTIIEFSPLVNAVISVRSKIKVLVGLKHVFVLFRPVSAE